MKNLILSKNNTNVFNVIEYNNIKDSVDFSTLSNIVLCNMLGLVITNPLFDADASNINITTSLIAGLKESAVLLNTIIFNNTLSEYRAEALFSKFLIENHNQHCNIIKFNVNCEALSNSQKRMLNLEFNANFDTSKKAEADLQRQAEYFENMMLSLQTVEVQKDTLR